MQKIPAILIGIYVIFVPLLETWTKSPFHAATVSVLSVAVIAAILLIRCMLTRRYQSINVRFTWSDLLVVAYLLYGLLNILWVREEPLSRFVWFKWFAMGLCYVLLRVIAEKQLVWYFLCAGGCLQSVIAILQKCGMLESNHAIFATTGSFGNPGQLGGFLAVSFAISLVLLLQSMINSKKTKSILLGVSLAVIGYGLILSDSRSGWIAAFGATVYLFLQVELPVLQRMKRQIVGSRILQIGLLCSVLCLSVFLYFHKEDSANGRLLIWRTSATMIFERPFFGHGVGSFSEKNLFYQARYFQEHPNSSLSNYADNPAYTYNEFLHIGVEQGCIGVFLLITLLLALLKNMRRSLVPAVGLITWVIYSLFSYPAEVFSLLLLCAVFSGAIKGKTAWTLRLWPPAWIVLPIVCVLLTTIGVTSYYSYRKEINDISRQFSSNKATCFTSVWLKNNLFMDIYAQWAVSHLPPKERLPILLEAKQVTPTTELLCDLGDTYLELNNPNQAVTYYKQALFVTPNRLTPSYHLFKLYRASKDTIQARHWGEYLLLRRVKVESTATLRMKADVNAFLFGFKTTMQQKKDH